MTTPGMLRVVLLALALLLAVPVGAAETAAPRGSAESLTAHLVALGAQHAGASGAARGRLEAQLVALAVARQQLLGALVETDPATVLRVAVPGPLRATLPPAARAYVEQRVQEDGDLEVLHEDGPGGGRYLYHLETARERLALHFAGPAPELATGTRVRVQGVRVNGALALDGSASVQALAPAVPNTFGEQRTVVILVNFQDKPSSQPYTLDHARNVVFTTTSSFKRENSFGQTWLAGNVHGWYTIALDSTACDYNKLATLARQAATAAGVDLALYRRIVYGFPKNSCSWWGLGTVGGNPSQSWINGTFSLAVVGHELGHNLGLYHSKALECGSVTLGSGCTSVEYGDKLDIMGSASSAHFNAFQKERLGWLGYGASPPVVAAETDGVYTLTPYVRDDGGSKAVKVVQAVSATGKRTWYYLEYRTALGFDAFLGGNGNVLNGVVAHLGTEGSGNSSYLLDMTPATSSWLDPALGVGQAFTDPTTGVTILPLWADGQTAGVSVTFGSVPCVRYAPGQALAPAGTQWISPGTAATYTVSVTSADTSGCPAADFAMQASVPAGWTATFAAPVLRVAPETTASTSLQLTPPASAAPGFYGIPVTATSSAGSGTASATASISVVSGLSVTVSSDRASYTPSARSVVLTAAVSASGSPVSGAAVTFSVQRPDGKVASSTATTDATGQATYSFRPKRQDPPGIYTVTATARLGEGVTGSASTTFTLQ